MWTFFNNESYYGLWAVRRAGDKDFNSQELFHVQSKEEAIALCATLNGYELGCSAAWNVSGGH
jgi:hypothetical protein